MANNSFTLDLRKYVESVKGDIDKTVRMAVIDVGKRLIEASPVGDRELWAENFIRANKGLPLTPPGYVGGKFKNSWDMAVDGPPTALYRVPDKDGADSKARIEAAIPDKAAGNIFYIVNTQPYAVALEDGHSTQAPLGIVELTVFDWATIVKNAVAKVQGGSA